MDVPKILLVDPPLKIEGKPQNFAKIAEQSTRMFVFIVLKANQNSGKVFLSRLIN